MVFASDSYDDGYAEGYRAAREKYVNNAQRYKEALEFYANFPYERGLVYVKKEDVAIPIDYSNIMSTYKPCKYSYDKGEIAKNALKNNLKG